MHKINNNNNTDQTETVRIFIIKFKLINNVNVYISAQSF